MTLYRAAVIGCGRIGSTIDDEQVNKPQIPLSLGSCSSLHRS